MGADVWSVIQSLAISANQKPNQSDFHGEYSRSSRGIGPCFVGISWQFVFFFCSILYPTIFLQPPMLSLIILQKISISTYASREPHCDISYQGYSKKESVMVWFWSSLTTYLSMKILVVGRTQKNPWLKVMIQLLKLSLVVNWDKIPVEGNALAAAKYQMLK